MLSSEDHKMSQSFLILNKYAEPIRNTNIKYNVERVQKKFSFVQVIDEWVKKYFLSTIPKPTPNGPSWDKIYPFATRYFQIILYINSAAKKGHLFFCL